jgi:hypothetical protein
VLHRNSVAENIFTDLGNYSNLVTGTLIRTKILYITWVFACEFQSTPQNIIHDKEVRMLQKILQCLATRVPRIVLQTAEELFPAVKETGVFCACLHRQEFYCHMSVLLDKETKYVLISLCLF